MTTTELCACGKPADHVNADPDVDEGTWACLVPNFDPATGVRLPPVGKYAPAVTPSAASGVTRADGDGPEVDRQFPPSNPTPGFVSFRIEAWPHDPGANGEDYHAGHLPAAEVAHVLRDLADRCENDWANPECPWPDEHGRDGAR